MELERIFFPNWDEIKQVLRKHVPWKVKGNSQKLPPTDGQKAAARKEKKQELSKLDDTTTHKMKRC